MSIKIVTYGPKHGQCNICGELAALTEDHTPPKGCIRLGQIQIQHIADHLSAELARGDGRVRKFQSGLKYRTLCANCNNNILGIRNDPILINFVNTIIENLQSFRDLHYGITVTTKPQRLMRSLLGHISAQGVDRYQKGKNTDPLRDYMLDESKSLPDFLTIYYWLYPYQRQVLIRDAAFLDLSIKDSKPVGMWLLKFFPIAFLIAWGDEPEYIKLNKLSDWRSIAIDDEKTLVIPTIPSIHPYWPEAPTDTSLVVYGQEAVASFTKKNSQSR